MMELDKRRSIDLLVDQFWKQGYLTVSRKFGTYLPEPSKVGSFDIDVLARYKKNYAIGITLSESDIKDAKIIDKLNYLGTRQTKYSNKRVLLFIGVPQVYFKLAKELLEFIDSNTRRNIRLLPIVEKSINSNNRKRLEEPTLFS